MTKKKSAINLIAADLGIETDDIQERFHEKIRSI